MVSYSNTQNSLNSDVLPTSSKEAQELLRQGWDLYLGENGACDIAKAAKMFKKSIDLGIEDPSVFSTLGRIYHNGEDVTVDMREAVVWYTKAADMGNIEAQYRLGIILRNGDKNFNIKKDEEKSFYWLRKAASQGHRNAKKLAGLTDQFMINDIGGRLFSGSIMKAGQSEIKPIIVFHSDSGNSGMPCIERGIPAESSVSTCLDQFEDKITEFLTFMTDEDVLIYLRYFSDYASSFQKWPGDERFFSYYILDLIKDKQYKQAFRIAHNTATIYRYTGSQLRLGQTYEGGFGTPVNYPEALKWYKKAASKGDKVASYTAGVFYLKGRGVEKDLCASVKYFKESAEKSYAPAQHNLANRYANGDCVPQDFNKAISLYRAAASQNYQLSLDTLIEISQNYQLSPDILREIDLLASNKPVNPQKIRKKTWDEMSSSEKDEYMHRNPSFVPNDPEYQQYQFDELMKYQYK